MSEEEGKCRDITEILIFMIQGKPNGENKM